MSIGLRLDLKQSQQLVMTPQLQQAIRLLQMSNLELAEFVAGEVERNPLLRLEDGSGQAAAPHEASAIAPLDRQVATQDPGLVAETFDFSAGDAAAENLFDGERAARPSPPPKTDAGTIANAAGYDFDQAPDRPVSLRAHLLAQLGQVAAAPDVLLLARVLVEELDEHGYLRTDPGEIAVRLGAPAADGAAALAMVQNCEPTGVGARDIAECLALQLAERDRLDPAMRSLLDNLDLIGRGQARRLQALCGVDAEDFADMLAELRRLDPRPCAGFAAEEPETLVPDLILTRGQQPGTWQVELNPETLPRVLLDTRYAAEVGDVTRSDPEAQSFLQGCRSDANWLIRSLDQRARSILAVATEIIRRQGAFFDQGVAGLRPLTLAMVAESTGLHESTVSRVTANKYIQTERGTFGLKFFFTNAIAADGPTAQAIRDRIRRMIDAEPASAILSDDEIVENLQKDGVEIARRTVAKYRTVLGIPSSVERRRRKALLPQG